MGRPCSWTALVFRTEVSVMQGKTKEMWMQLPEQAAVEQDPAKLLELVKKINRMLEEKEKRLIRTREQSTKHDL
jgi:hypothetical protein